MIDATFNAIAPTPIIAEFEAIIPREKALEVKNKNITIEQNGTYTVKADADTTMTEVGVEVDIDMGADLSTLGYTKEMQDKWSSIIREGIANTKKLSEEWKPQNNSVGNNFSGRGYNAGSKFMPDIDTSSLTSLQEMFFYNREITYIDMSRYDTSKVTSMRGMCDNCTGLKFFTFGSCDLNNVTTMESMFNACNSIETIDFGNEYKNTKNLTKLNNFCTGNLKRLKLLDFSKINTTNVTTIDYLIRYGGGYEAVGCASLTGLNIRSVVSAVGFLQNYNTIKTVELDEWRQTNLNFNTCNSLSPESINYIIEHALGEEDGATQRTLTLHATAKSNWQKNAEYEKYSAMAYDKLITIA